MDWHTDRRRLDASVVARHWAAIATVLALGLVAVGCSNASPEAIGLAHIGPSRCVDTERGKQLGVDVGEFPALDLTETLLEVVGQELRVHWTFSGPVVMLDGNVAPSTTDPRLLIGVLLRTGDGGSLLITASGRRSRDTHVELSTNRGRVASWTSTSVDLAVPLDELGAVETGLAWDAHVEYEATTISGPISWWDDCANAPYSLAP